MRASMFTVFVLLSAVFLLMVGSPDFVRESSTLKWIILTSSNGGNPWAFIALQWMSFGVGVYLWRRGGRNT